MTAAGRAADLFLAAAPEYMFTKESGGYINRDPNTQAIFIASGAGIPKGIRPGDSSNLDVAHTVAVLLGLEMKPTQGHPIPQIAGK